MKIAVFGIRGFPKVQGGVEKHCEELYPRLANFGCKMVVFTRTPFIPRKNRVKKWKKVHFIHLWCPKVKGLEALFHSFLASLITLSKNPEMVHIHNIGPSLFLPLLKIFGLKVIVTYHSPNYEHEKWNYLSKKILKLAERIVMRLADRVIFISNFQFKKLGSLSKSQCIPNGIVLPKAPLQNDYLSYLNLNNTKYILGVGRLTPEKGFLDLVKIFSKFDNNWKLVIVGGADYKSKYYNDIIRHANQNKNIILTGILSSEPLSQLYSAASLFVLPSYHEGQSLALLEALSYGLPVLVSDIHANKEFKLPKYRYYPLADLEALNIKIKSSMKIGINNKEKKDQIEMLKQNYNWSKIAKQTFQVYNSVTNF